MQKEYKVQMPAYFFSVFYDVCLNKQKQSDVIYVASRKHAFIILTPLNPLLYSKTGVYRGIHYFSYVAKKQRLWVLVRTASPRRF